MLAVVAAVVFAVALIIDWAGLSTSVILAPESLMLIGLILLALHLAGFGPAVNTSGLRTRSRSGRR